MHAREDSLPLSPADHSHLALLRSGAHVQEPRHQEDQVGEPVGLSRQHNDAEAEARQGLLIVK